AVREKGVTPEELDDACGDGAALTALISPDNPHHGVEFRTSWQHIMVNITAWAGPGPEAKLSLGRVFAVPSLLENVTRDEIILAVRRHAAGDCGDVSEEERDSWSETLDEDE